MAERAPSVGVGCFGLGFLAVHLWQSLERLDGVDPLPRLPIAVADPALQQYLDEIRSRVNYVQTQENGSPFEDATYDLCACINVVDHAQSPRRSSARSTPRSEARRRVRLFRSAPLVGGGMEVGLQPLAAAERVPVPSPTPTPTSGRGPTP